MSTGGTETNSGLPGGTQEPWLGLESYSEVEAQLFHGREAETDELLRLLRREVLTILFGTSGTGKTSLLNAGLFPRLRDQGFLPVPIRIDYSDTSGSLATQLRSAISNAVGTLGIEESAPNGDGTTSGEATAWEYLHRTSFWDKRNNPLTPVIVFDQFEELFTIGRQQPAARAFVTELSDLVENYIPETVRRRMERTGEPLGFDLKQHYKVLIALREDFVSRLDSLRTLAPSIMHNRFALTRMDGRQALRPVLLPGAGIVSEAVAEQIVRKVASADQQTPLEELVIDPALLSLMCRELNARRLTLGLGVIPADLVNSAASDILSDFYERSFQGLSPGAKAFVEDRLLTSDGFRTTAAVDAAVHEGLHEDMNVLVNRRVLRSEERLGLPHLELTHDVLTKVALVSRNERQERQRRAEDDRRRTAEESARRAELKRTRRSLVIVGVVAFACLILAVVAFVSYRTAATSLKESLGRQLAAQSRTVGLRRAALPLSTLLAVESSQRFPSFDASQALRANLTLLPRETGQIVLGHKVAAALFTRNARYLTTASDEDIRVWDLGSRRQIQTIKTPQKAEALAVSEDGKIIATSSASSLDVVVFDSAATPLTPKVLKGEGPTRILVFSPDGAHLAAAGRSPVTTVWDTRSLESVSLAHEGMESLSGEVRGVAFHPDGSLVAITRRTTTGIWRVGDWKQIHSLEHDTGEVRGVAFSPDGKYLVAATAGSAQMWEVPGMQPVARFAIPVIQGSGNPNLGFDRKGRFIAVGAGAAGRVWRLAGNRGRTELVDVATIQHDGDILAMAFSPDGAYVASGGDDGTASVFSLDGGREVGRMPPGDAIVNLMFVEDGRALMTVGADGTARLWETSGFSAVAVIPFTDNAFTSTVATIASSDSDASIRGLAGGPLADPEKYAAVASIARRLLAAEIVATGLRILDLRNGEEIARLEDEALTVTKGFNGRVPFAKGLHTVTFSPDGRYLSAISTNLAPQVWELASRRRIDLPSLQAPADGDLDVMDTAFSPDGTRVAVRDSRETLHVFELPSARPLPDLVPAEDSERLAFSPDGRYLATLHRTVQIWDMQALRTPPLVFKANYSQPAVFSPDSRYLATFQSPGIVVRLSDRQTVATIQHDGDVEAVAFDPQGTRLASVGRDRTARIWDLTNPGAHARLPHDAGVLSVAFSPDGQYLATGEPYMDGGVQPTARVWTADGSTELARLEHVRDVQQVAFSENGKYLLTVSRLAPMSSESIRVLLWRSEDLVAEACRRLTRNLTESEWRTHLSTEPYRKTCANLP